VVCWRAVSVVTIAAALLACAGESRNGNGDGVTAVAPSPVVTEAPAPSPTPAPTETPLPPTETPEPPTVTPPAQVPVVLQPAPTSPPPPPPPPPPPTSPPAPPAAVVFNVVAQGIAYNLTTLTARSGARVTVNFRNNDTAVPHDITFGPIPGLPHGNTCNGPCTDTYTFTAPAPGSYQFFCTVHAEMLGSFIVTP
jgi:plastocyanin